ncbi:MAG: hypothetical protein WAQ08_09630 [Aquabacterium sp.]|jgi:hypothetical protein|uniref:hypothetical protein n=1 Tax=Aquabacterium sp. TaxID=1872578 RepID=UPI003BAE88B5
MLGVTRVLQRSRAALRIKPLPRLDTGLLSGMSAGPLLRFVMDHPSFKAEGLYGQVSWTQAFNKAPLLGISNDFRWRRCVIGTKIGNKSPPIFNETFITH